MAEHVRSWKVGKWDIEAWASCDPYWDWGMAFSVFRFHHHAYLARKIVVLDVWVPLLECRISLTVKR